MPELECHQGVRSSLPTAPDWKPFSKGCRVPVSAPSSTSLCSSVAGRVPTPHPSAWPGASGRPWTLGLYFPRTQGTHSGHRLLAIITKQ